MSPRPFPGTPVAASDVVELISSQSTSSASVFIYDVAEQAGFGPLTKQIAQQGGDVASVIPLQTRAGAGLSLVGRLSQSTSHDGARGSVLTAYTTPTGLAVIIPSLIHLPSPSSSSRLVVQVPTVTPVGDKFSLSPTLAPLNSVFPILPATFAVILSATPQEAVDLAVAAYKLSTHVIHLFDHYSAAREIGRLQVPSLPIRSEGSSDIGSVLKSAGYAQFDYSGDKAANTVLVFLNGPFALAAKATSKNTPGLGVLVVRVLRPWDEQMFRAVLPSSVKSIHVVEDLHSGATQGVLYGDVFSSVFVPSGTGPIVHSKALDPESSLKWLNDPTSFASFITSTVGYSVASSSVASALESKLLFFSTPGTPLSIVPSKVEQTFTASDRLSSRLLTEHDIFSKPGAIQADRILLTGNDTSTDFVPLPFALSLRGTGASNFLAVLDPSLLKSHALLEHAKEGSVVLVAASWSAAELVSNLHPSTISTVKKRHVRVCAIDAQAVSSQITLGDSHVSVPALVVHLTFLRLYLGPRATQEAVAAIAQSVYAPSIGGKELLKVASQIWSALREVDLLDVTGEESALILKDFGFNAIAASTEDGEPIVNGATLGSWHDAAKHLLFPSAFTPPVEPSDEQYPQIPSLRPELPERTHLITCTVNRRLTPLDYERNVFHVEFDTSGTGLKYEIGEALGVHGWNDLGDVLDFCAWYGLDPSQLITIPVPSDDTKRHTRTVLQALQQQIDLFGKPPKSFFTELAAFTTNSVDKHALQFIGSVEGVSTFKKLSEKDTITFADVLRRYASARPGVEVLCELVGDIKPRHYSIASAQSVVGDRVDLLVVTVEWATPSGSPRFGQCTRYLASLKPGQKATVSIKPSVMKLPADPMQPLIMAGLGTGAAPLRAFCQHRAMLMQKGIPVGPAYYYFGSRRRSEEYLYGEEIEAYIADGVITKAGLAFSRDGPSKVYIQSKMLEDAQTLAHMLHAENGVFYLCGPTWPVPDVFEALRSALAKHHGLDLDGAAAYLEGLKEEERYVLEVY